MLDWLTPLLLLLRVEHDGLEVEQPGIEETRAPGPQSMYNHSRLGSSSRFGQSVHLLLGLYLGVPGGSGDSLCRAGSRGLWLSSRGFMRDPGWTCYAN